MNDYHNPNKFQNLSKSKGFSKYLGFSLVAIFVILIFLAIVWISGGKQAGIPDQIVFLQLETPADDAPVVVFETNKGTMKAVLYPDEAPKYCEYFISMVESGYYNGTYICANVDAAYCLGGTKFPDPDHAETEDSDFTQIEAEISNNLWPITGSLCSYVGTSGMWPFDKNCAGSTFILVNDIADAYMDKDALIRAYGEQLGNVFSEKGGIPTFSRKYTIFGQVVDGMDTWEAIFTTESLESNQPAEDIIFENVYMSTYGEEMK